MDGGSQCRCHRPGAHIAPSATHRSGRGHPAVVPPVRAGQEQKPGHGTAPQPAPRPSTANLRWWARWTCPEAQSAAEPEGYELFMHDARENGVQRRGGISQRRHANGSRCIPPRIPARPPLQRGADFSRVIGAEGVGRWRVVRDCAGSCHPKNTAAFPALHRMGSSSTSRRLSADNSSGMHPGCRHDNGRLP